MSTRRFPHTSAAAEALVVTSRLPPTRLSLMPAPCRAASCFGAP